MGKAQPRRVHPCHKERENSPVWVFFARMWPRWPATRLAHVVAVTYAHFLAEDNGWDAPPALAIAAVRDFEALGDFYRVTYPDWYNAAWSAMDDLHPYIARANEGDEEAVKGLLMTACNLLGPRWKEFVNRYRQHERVGRSSDSAG